MDEELGDSHYGYGDQSLATLAMALLKSAPQDRTVASAGYHKWKVDSIKEEQGLERMSLRNQVFSARQILHPRPRSGKRLASWRAYDQSRQLGHAVHLVGTSGRGWGRDSPRALGMPARKRPKRPGPRATGRVGFTYGALAA